MTSGIYICMTREDTKNAEFSLLEPNIRVRYTFMEYEPGSEIPAFEFQIYTRPFWFGWFRKKRWETVMITNGYYEGLDFCQYLLK